MPFHGSLTISHHHRNPSSLPCCVSHFFFFMLESYLISTTPQPRQCSVRCVLLSLVGVLTCLSECAPRVRLGHLVIPVASHSTYQLEPSGHNILYLSYITADVDSLHRCSYSVLLMHRRKDLWGPDGASSIQLLYYLCSTTQPTAPSQPMSLTPTGSSTTG